MPNCIKCCPICTFPRFHLYAGLPHCVYTPRCASPWELQKELGAASGRCKGAALYRSCARICPQELRIKKGAATRQLHFIFYFLFSLFIIAHFPAFVKELCPRRKRPQAAGPGVVVYYEELCSSRGYIICSREPLSSLHAPEP